VSKEQPLSQLVKAASRLHVNLSKVFKLCANLSTRLEYTSKAGCSKCKRLSELMGNGKMVSRLHKVMCAAAAPLEG
jgi:hypothetical protein